MAQEWIYRSCNRVQGIDKVLIKLLKMGVLHIYRNECGVRKVNVSRKMPLLRVRDTTAAVVALVGRKAHAHMLVTKSKQGDKKGAHTLDTRPSIFQNGTLAQVVFSPGEDHDGLNLDLQHGNDHAHDFNEIKSGAFRHLQHLSCGSCSWQGTSLPATSKIYFPRRTIEGQSYHRLQLAGRTS